MERPVFTAFIFIVICACVALVGMIYFQTHQPLSAVDREGPEVDRGVSEQVNQIMHELDKVE